MGSVVNLTPHAVNIVDADGKTLAVFPPSGVVARLSQTNLKIGEVSVDGIAVEIARTTYGELSGFP
ncbi:MAG: hypothetical protein KF772_04805 [Cryobacterium sp.]|nr:hypothetical protein [Cryobacterium sp.]